jgi:hypothetical protein
LNRRQAVRSIAFIALFLACVTMLTYCLRTNGAVKDRFAGFYAEKKNTLDVVMIGSSPVFPYYSTPEMYGEEGIVCYPLSTNLQRPIAQLYLAKEALKYQKPALMIFEVRMYTGREGDMTQNMAYTRGVTDNLRYSLNRIDAINAMTDPKYLDSSATDTEKYTYYFDIFKYHANWRSLYLFSQWQDFLYCVPDRHKGYEASTDVCRAQLPDYSGVTQTSAIEADQDLHLTELMDWLRQNNQQALFIVSPYNMLEEEKEKNYNYIGQRVTAEGFGFLNMNLYYSGIGLDPDTDFKDNGNHTNASGAAKVTKWFEAWLKEHYDLPDRRGDSTYASWQQAYELWQTEQTAGLQTISDHIAKGEYAVPGEEN